MAANNSLLLADQNAVVTGSSTGIGRAIAIELARAGANVLIHAKQNASAAAKTVEDVQRCGRHPNLILADLTDLDELNRFVEQAWQWREIDIWVNNAGADVLTGDQATWSFEEKFHLLWLVDVRATIMISRAVGARMKQRGPRCHPEHGVGSSRVRYGG